MKDPSPILRGLLLRLWAKDKIIRAHQTGLAPPEKVFSVLEKTKTVEQRAADWLEKASPNRGIPTEGK